MSYPLTRELWALAWPAILRNMLNCACDRLTLALVGQYDPSTAHYDGAGLGKMYSNITGLSVGFGINLGLATLCSQAYGAGRSAEENALHLRRCCVWLAIAFVYSTVTVFFAESILLLASQPADVAAASAAYARVQLAGVPMFWAANALQTVCDGLQNTRPGLWSNLISAVAQVALSVILVHPRCANLGYLGMAAARSIGGAVCLLLMVLLVQRAKLQHLVWRLPPVPPGADAAVAAKARVLSGVELRRFMAVALPSACVMWIEWWSFEGFGLITGTLPDAKVLLAAHGTLFNVLVVFYMFFTGLSTALCATTGKYIGRGAPHVAPSLITIALLLAVTLAAGTAAALYLARWPLARLFESDAAVQTAIAENMVGACLSVPGYAVLMTLYGACRGANRQNSVFAGTALGYASGIPLAWLLGKRLAWPPGRPLLGVWLGNVWALSLAALWALVVVARLPWRTLRPVRPLGGGSVGSGAGGGEAQRGTRTEALLAADGGGDEPTSEAIGWSASVRPVNE